MTRDIPTPVGTCIWQKPDGTLVSVHLWPLEFEDAVDSHNGLRYSFRRCLVCGTPDMDELTAQNQLHRREGGL